MDSCNNKRQRIYDSVSITKSNDDIRTPVFPFTLKWKWGTRRAGKKKPSDNTMCNENAAGVDHQYSDHRASKFDNPEEGNGTHEDNHKIYRKLTDISTQRSAGNSMIACACPDIFDFETNRDANRFAVGQIWALYDKLDVMPRFYARIMHFDAHNHKIHLTWLEHEATNKKEEKWTNKKLPVACRSFCLQPTVDTSQDANSSADNVCSDNVAGGENQAAESAPSTLDSQDERNKTHESCKKKCMKHRTYIPNQMHGNPVITYECPDFFDFGKLRDVNRIAVNQIWAIYDHNDFMPRVYAQINDIDAWNNNVELTWLENNTKNLQETRWTREELPVACGNFCLGETCVVHDPSMYLSHRVSWVKGKNGDSFEIRPKKSEVWALYKKSSSVQGRDTDNHQSIYYDVVEVFVDSMSDGIIVSPLVRVEGFVSLFAESKDRSRILIPSSELHRFSHRIPCYRTNGSEKVGVGGLLELDTAALPCDSATAFPSITLDSFINLDKKKVSEFISVTYPDKKLPIACGSFCLQPTVDTSQDRFMFSHIVAWRKGKKGNSYEIYPNKGEVWALYKGWNMQLNSDTDNYASYEYEVVEVLSTWSADDGATVIPLVKIKDFVSLFARAKGKSSFVIPPSELLRFSHSISFYRTNGNEKIGLPRDFLELDTACLPADLNAAFSSVALVSYMSLGNMTGDMFIDLTTDSADSIMGSLEDNPNYISSEQNTSAQKKAHGANELSDSS